MELAVERHRSRAGSSGACCSSIDWTVDLSLETDRSSSHCRPASHRVAHRLQTRASTGTSAGIRRSEEMRVNKIAFAVVIALIACLPALAQSRRIMGGSAGGSKYQFFYDTFLDPSLPELGNMGGGTVGGEGT